MEGAIPGAGSNGAISRRVDEHLHAGIVRSQAGTWGYKWKSIRTQDAGVTEKATARQWLPASNVWGQKPNRKPWVCIINPIASWKLALQMRSGLTWEFLRKQDAYVTEKAAPRRRLPASSVWGQKSNRKPRVCAVNPIASWKLALQRRLGLTWEFLRKQDVCVTE